MDEAVKVRIITQNDLLHSGCFNIPDVIDVVENTLFNFDNDNLYFPDKSSMIFDEEKQSRINFLPAGFKDIGIYGGKWVSVFPENPKEHGVQNLTAVNILSELTTGFPVAFMEGTLESNLRTAAVGAIAAKYLSNQQSEIIGFIGGGEQAKSHFMTMKSVRPSIKTCKISSRTGATEQKFIDQMKPLYPDVNFIPCKGNYRLAVEDADIIVTAISGQEEILKAAWIKRGAFYCHVAGLEDEYAVALLANKIVVDSWEVVKHRTQTISRMYKEGILKDDNIYADLYEIVQNKKAGREHDTEFIYFNSVGLSYIDTAVAYSMYKKVIAKGLGTEIIMCGSSMFEADSNLIVV